MKLFAAMTAAALLLTTPAIAQPDCYLSASAFTIHPEDDDGSLNGFTPGIGVGCSWGETVQFSAGVAMLYNSYEDWSKTVNVALTFRVVKTPDITIHFGGGIALMEYANLAHKYPSVGDYIPVPFWELSASGFGHFEPVIRYVDRGESKAINFGFRYRF